MHHDLAPWWDEQRKRWQATGRFSAAPRQWFTFLGKAPGECDPDDPDCPDAFDLSIFDEIGGGYFSDGVTAKALIATLEALPAKAKTIRVHVNSPGGDVFEAIAIANAFRAQSRDKGRRVEMHIEGLAASAATLITCAGDAILVADNALMMVHNPFGVAIGTAEEMRATAEALDRVRAAIVATYQWTSKLSPEALGALMDATTWMSAEEAVANGFAGEVVSGVRAAASLRSESLRALGEVPAQHRARLEALIAPPAPVAAPAPAATAAPIAASAADVLRLCREAECLDLAEPLIAAQASLEAATARTARARQIATLCATAKLPELAAGYRTADTPVGVVRAQLTALAARLAGAEIDSGLRPDPSRDELLRSELNPSAIYTKRNERATASKGV